MVENPEPPAQSDPHPHPGPHSRSGSQLNPRASQWLGPRVGAQTPPSPSSSGDLSGHREVPDAEAIGATGATSAISTPGWLGTGQRPLRLLLLRHGQTPMSVAGVFSGRSDPGLTDTGHAQARRAASWLRVRQDTGEGIDAVYTSPLLRARQTAVAAAAALDLEVTVDNDLIETDFGVWEGLGFEEVYHRWPAEHSDWIADPSVPAVGGESMDAVSDRCSRLITGLSTPGHARTVLLVSHVSPIKAILRQAMQVPSTVYSTMHLDLAGLSVVEFYPDRSVAREVNDIHYLRGL